jgi:hypothetical protein
MYRGEKSFKCALKPEGELNLIDLGVRGRITIKWGVKEAR